tara:strand:+ start:2430 stop:2930 length:501 start_codon:yes stop_codon:yes gene_type:complete
MAINTTQTADCNKVIIRVTSPDPQATHEILVTGPNGTYNYTFPGGPDNTRIVLASQVGGGNGVFIIDHIVDGQVFARKGILFACDVLCCIAHKINELLDCDCDCNKCSPHFVEAQKIFLLLKTAENELATSSEEGTIDQIQAVIDNAKRKYLTAQDMCAGHCGCNC